MNYAKAALSESKEGWIDADFSRLFQNTPLMPAVGKRIIIRPPLATKKEAMMRGDWGEVSRLARSSSNPSDPSDPSTLRQAQGIRRVSAQGERRVLIQGDNLNIIISVRPELVEGLNLNREFRLRGNGLNQSETECGEIPLATKDLGPDQKPPVFSLYSTVKNGYLTGI